MQIRRFKTRIDFVWTRDRVFYMRYGVKVPMPGGYRCIFTLDRRWRLRFDRWNDLWNVEFGPVSFMWFYKTEKKQ